MIRINLLPYRAARRQAQILQHLVVVLGAVALAVLISLTAHWIGSAQLSSLQEDYARIRAENVALQKKIGKIKDLDNLRADVERKLKLVDELQQGRFRSLKTFDAISRTIPENVWLSGVDDKGNSINLNGLGESNTAVANFMRNLEASETFSNVRLQVIARETVNGSVVRRFSLTCDRAAEKTDKPEDKPAKGKAS